MHIVERKSIYFDSTLNKVQFLPVHMTINVSSGTRSVPNRRQTIAWSNDIQGLWRHMALENHNELSRDIENADGSLGKACFPWKTRFDAISLIKAKEMCLPCSNILALRFSE